MAQLANDDERNGLDRLSRTHGSASLGVAVLALLVRMHPAAAAGASILTVWAEETAATPNAAAIEADVALLSDASRLPCLEALVQRARQSPKPDRRALLQATRRLMAARKPVPPIDRLLWLAMRRWLGEHPPPAAMPGAHNDLAKLPPAMQEAIALFSAHLARLVPGHADGDGAAWMTHVLDRLDAHGRPAVPAAPDGDALTHALHAIQTLPWMLRPVLVRAWVDAARQVGPRLQLQPSASDALRLAAGLLDSPLPPELARGYVELCWSP